MGKKLSYQRSFQYNYIDIVFFSSFQKSTQLQIQVSRYRVRVKKNQTWVLRKSEQNQGSNKYSYKQPSHRRCNFLVMCSIMYFLQTLETVKTNFMKYITMTMLFKYLVLIPQVTSLPPLEKDTFSFSSQNLSISTSWPIQKCRCYALLLLTTQRSSRMHNKWGRITRLALFPVEKFEHFSHLFGVNINQGQLEVTNYLF